MNKLLILLLLLPFRILAQLEGNWQHFDPEQDSVLGVSTYRAYEYLKDIPSKTVIVAILDNGVDLKHEDLQGRFWVNPNELAGNGIDDDKNGYIDDINGWNFLGNQKGENMKRETTELTRIYAKLRLKFTAAGFRKYTHQDSIDSVYYEQIKADFENELSKKQAEINLYNLLLLNFRKADSLLVIHFDTVNYNIDSLRILVTTDKMLDRARNFMLEMNANQLTYSKIEGIISNLEQDLETRLNPFFNARKEIIGDNPDDLSDSIYGNNMVDAAGPYHGTGMAGTIGALWNNIGINGLAKNVKLMILRVLPNGDEHDKDIALAIRYAVRNGAQIISCSFGKLYSSHPEFVQLAIKEAENAGVLIVHAAGNDGQNNDSIPTYPTGFYEDGKRASNWLAVGACTSKDNVNLVAFFSNYGKKSVDVFAPGVDIISCVPGNKYEPTSGTSVAAPIVAGIAATLKSYYPMLTANQLKKIIIRSVYIPITQIVYSPGNKKNIVPFKDLSVSGGVANLYRSVLLIEKEYKH